MVIVGLIVSLAWFGLFFALPAIALAKLCADRVVRALPDQRTRGWAGVLTRLLLLAALVGALVLLGVIAGGMTATAGETGRVLHWMFVKTGAVFALMGWLAPVVLAHLMEPNRKTELLVCLSPAPFLVIGLAVLVWFAGSSA